MISWGHAFGELRRRRGRSLLSLLSVAIAVGAIVAVAAAVQTTRSAYLQVFQALAGNADVEVISSGRARFQQSVADPLRSLAGVRAVTPVFHQPTILYWQGRKLKVLAAGIVVDDPESLSGFRLAEGRWPTAAGEVMLDVGLAESLGAGVGDEVKLLTSLGIRPRPQKICGLVKTETAVRLLEGGTLLAPLDRLQRLYRSAGQVDALHLSLAPGHSAEEVIAAASQVLPQQIRACVPSARSGLAKETLLMTEVSLMLATALAFTTALFIALSMFLMNVGERRRELSILRAIGATRRQVVGAVCREAIVLGLLGTALGIPCGMFGGKLLAQAMAGMLEIPLPQSSSLSWALALGIVLGPAICLLGAWYPARLASRVSPLEGMQPVVTLHARQGHRAITVVGLAGCALATVLCVACVRGVAPMSVAVFTVILSLVSLMLLWPAILAPAVRLLARPTRRLAGVEGDMSERLVLRHAGRSSLTIGVLFIAVSAVVGLGNSVSNVIDDIRSWYEQMLSADFLVRSLMPDTTGQDATSMSESVGAEIEALQGVAWIDSLRSLRVEAGGQDAILIARGMGNYLHSPAAQAKYARDPEVLALRRGEVVIGSVLAQRAGVGVGELLPVEVGTAHHAFRVAAVTSDYSSGGSTVYVDRKIAEQLFPISGVDAFLVKADRPVPPQLESQLQSLAEKQGALLQSFSELLGMINATVLSVTGGLWILLTLILLVGALGIVNTLTMNVLEQRRELGMLRAIGMRRSQIVRTVLGQAACMGLLGVLSGTAIGLVLARMINLCMGSLFGHPVHFAVRPQIIGLLLIAALFVVMLAALFPARRAARANPVEAMRQQ